jgi:glycogenin
MQPDRLIAATTRPNPAYSYITVLSTDHYVEGVVVLAKSLHRVGSHYPFWVLTTPNLKPETLEQLDRHGIQRREVPPIVVETDVPEHQRRWQWTYVKLHIFNQTQFAKLVYLDADMLVYENLDELFNKPHMAAVNAGGMLPEYQHWREFNSGLMVVEPNAALYADMLVQLPKLYKPNGGDQDFLNAYYPDWPQQPEKHLDHGYNLFHIHLDRYAQRHGYQLRGQHNPVKVIHYVGEHKPWLIKAAIAAQQQWTLKNQVTALKESARWVLRSLRKQLPHRYQNRMPAAIGQRLQTRSLIHWLEIDQA